MKSGVAATEEAAIEDQVVRETAASAADEFKQKFPDQMRPFPGY